MSFKPPSKTASLLITLPFQSRDRKLLLEMANKVLERAGPELERRVGEWLVELRGAYFGEEDELFAALSMDVNALYLDEIREVIVRWWNHYADIYGVNEPRAQAPKSNPAPDHTPSSKKWWQFWK